MANSLRTVQLRIASTKSTAQITKAMHMVSQSKLKKSEKTYKSYQDFMNRIEDMTCQIISKASDDYIHPLIQKREIKKTAYLIITSDRGLAGAYNSSLFKAFEERITQKHKSYEEFVISAIGKKGFAFINKKKYTLISDEPIYVRDDVMFVDIEPLARKIIDSYLNKEIDNLVIVYNHYVNTLTQEITFKEILPLDNLEKKVTSVDYIYETGIEKTLDLLLPMYIKDILYGIILDAKISEHSARMNAMKNATDNAEEVIEKLQLLYNRARQSAITTELIDIIGGANAIGGDN